MRYLGTVYEALKTIQKKKEEEVKSNEDEEDRLHLSGDFKHLK